LSDDPRWDRQVESRAEYYATLATRLGFTARDLATAVVVSDSDAQNLVDEVVTEMARRGDPSGADWLARELEAHERGAAEGALGSPGGRRADQAPRIDSSVEELLSHDWPKPYPGPLLDRLAAPLPPADLARLHAAATGPFGGPSELTLAALARRRDPTALDTVIAAFTRGATGRERSSALRYVVALDPSVSLPVARAWIALHDDRFTAAALLLEQHATPDDRPLVIAALERAWESRHMYELCSLVDAVALHADMPPPLVLREVFTDVEYSWARGRAAAALAAADPDFPRLFARECLCDCEEDTRRVGMATGVVPAEEFRL
jgi:hypothetical protein